MSELPLVTNPENSGYPVSIQAGIPKLGPTPNGWKRFPLSELLRRIERPAVLSDSETYQLLTARRGRGGIVARERLSGKQIKTKTQFYAMGGDFLISNRQISHGACGIVPNNLHGAIVSNEYTTFLTSDVLEPHFLNLLSHSVYFQQTCFQSSIGIHVEKLVFRLNDWMKWEFDIPPLKEQQRILMVLGTWDQAIESTVRLILAKQRRKKALFQRLFSDLPKRPLLEAADIWFSGVDKRSNANEKPILLCNYMDVFHNARITSRIPFMKATASQAEIETNTLYKHDVVFTKDSETPDEIAESAVLAEDIEGLVCGYHLAIVRPREGVGYGPFIAQAMRHPQIRWQFCRLANGVVRFGLTLDSIEEIEIFLPALRIQRQIASALDAEDIAIEALTKHAHCLRVQKQGLMQKLLTGQWRLDERFDLEKPSRSSALAGRVS